jgi:hypothetical protein
VKRGQQRSWRVTNTLTKVGNTGLAHKDVKNEGRSGNVYENKGSADTMTDNYSGFCAWSVPFLQKLTEIRRTLLPKMHKRDDNWGEAGVKIGSSVHRLIDPSTEHGVGWESRRPDPRVTDCQSNGCNRFNIFNNIRLAQGCA